MVACALYFHSVTLSFSMVHQELHRRLQVIQPFVPDTDIRAEGV